MNQELLKVTDLHIFFRAKGEPVRAVTGVTFSVKKGETLGIVGESGAGKSVLGLSLMGLLPENTAYIPGGSIEFDGTQLLELKKKQLRAFRGDRIAMIFQDPYASLNPRMTVEDSIAEPMLVNKVFKTRGEAYGRVDELMEFVGLAPRNASLFPHEISGGLRQRVGIARALATNPEFIVCDEPVSALDVSIQAQILNLLMDLQDQLHISYLFISHDLSVVKHISHDVAVMYLGQCVESGPTEEIFRHPLHPYTRTLLDAIPTPTLCAIAHREGEYGSLEKHRDVLRKASPIHVAHQITAPLMVIHGANDPRVPVSEAEQIVKNLESRGVCVKYLCYGDEGHGIMKLANKLDCYPQVADFLKTHLR